MSGARVEVTGGIVRKFFSSHMQYSRESNVFAKLQGTGLGPELLTQFNGYLEYRLCEGESFLSAVCRQLSQPQLLAEAFEEFCSWYAAYKEKTNLILGGADPEKFIFTRDGLVYSDFSSCRPGYPEQDLASMVRGILDGAGDGGTAACLFICVCASHMSWRPELLEQYLRKTLAGTDPSAAEFLITYMTCSGVVISTGSGEAALQATSSVSAMPSRFLCAQEGTELRFPGFTAIPCRSEASAMCAAARVCSQPWMLLLSADVTGLNPQALRKLLASGKKDMEAVFYSDYWEHITPMLIRTKTVLSLIREDTPDDEVCAILKRSASVRLLIGDNLFTDE